MCLLLKRVVAEDWKIPPRFRN